MSNLEIIRGGSMKFEKTFCSQCGKALGPGSSGVSHCSDHSGISVEDLEEANVLMKQLIIVMERIRKEEARAGEVLDHLYDASTAFEEILILEERRHA